MSNSSEEVGQDLFQGSCPDVKRHKLMNFKDLQQRQKVWAQRNFPAQMFACTAKDVADVIYEIDDNSGRQISELVAQAINDGRLGRKWHHPILGSFEEIGELAHAFLKYEQGIRGMTHERFIAKAEDAVVDCIVFLCSFCSTPGVDIDLQEAVERIWPMVEKRDWIAEQDEPLEERSKYSKLRDRVIALSETVHTIPTIEGLEQLAKEMKEERAPSKCSK